MPAIRPLGHRLLIAPDAAATMTDSGIVIPEAYTDTPPMSGVVLRVGDGYLRDRRIRTKTIARCLRLIEDAEAEAAGAVEALVTAKDEMQRYLREAETLASIAAVGDRVVFPMEAGHELVLGEDADHPLVIVSEDSILAVLDAESVAA